MLKHPLVLVSVIVIGSLFSACNKEQDNHTLRVRLTDAPTALDEVNVDLQQVHVKMDRDSVQWVSLNTRPGVYNLLDLQNGVDTLIAEGSVGAGEKYAPHQLYFSAHKPGGLCCFFNNRPGQGTHHKKNKGRERTFVPCI
ncbi:MAG: DUF4382 domain-containing protein [Chitinophagaceae bacterium]|nr:MAG: DUF4382 domain-containing protein [Chitinophagaceae bacterium]